MASTTIDIILKLIQLSLKNPNREEAASAALKAVALIDKYQIPIGDNTVILKTGPAWTPPSQDFMDTVDDIMKNKKENPDDWRAGAKAKAGGQGLEAQTNEVVDPQEAWRTRMVDAWRALREARQQLTSEIYRYEQETRRKYEGEGRSW